jgi:hypothetical protein
MARARSLTNLIADVRARTNTENTQFVTDPEITEYVNQSITELYDLLLSAHGQEYYVKASTPFSTVAGTSAYALPADFYKLLGVDVSNGSDTWSIAPYAFAERNKYRVAAAWNPYEPTSYRLQAANINFLPIPQGTYTITLQYVPAATRLANPGDTFDGINGWEELVICDAGAKVLEKGEYDPMPLRSRVAALTQRVLALAGERDAGKPEKVTDVYVAERQWRRG